MTMTEGAITTTPLVSIGMPVYNGEQCIRKAIESVQAQSYSNLEILLCDNCSTDRTKDIILDYAVGDARIHYHRFTTHTDCVTNFYRALGLASGDFFMWACADDIRPPSCVEDLMAVILKYPSAGMVHGELLVKANESAKRIANRMRLMDKEPSRRVRQLVRGFEHNAMIYGLYRTKVLKEATFKLHFGRDFHLCLQMCLLGPVAYSPFTMITYNEKNAHPHINPMGPDRKITVTNLIAVGRTTRKAWVTLLYAFRYVLECGELSIAERIACLFALASEFIKKYHTRLLRDAILLFFLPVRWLLKGCWAIVRRSSVLPKV